MSDTSSRWCWNPWLVPILLAAAVFLSYGIWLTDPHLLGADEKSAVTKALWMGVNRSPFPPTFKKGGNLYLYVLAVSFVPTFFWLGLTTDVGSLAAEAGSLSDFFEASQEFREVFYAFVFTGRVTSVLMGLMTIYVVYRIGADRYEERVGLVAAAVLTVTAGFVQTGHFATEDMLLVLLTAVSLYLLSGNDRRLTLAAAITSGLAVSAKATGAFLVLPLSFRLVQADKWEPVKSVKLLFTGGTLSLFAYLMTTVSIFRYPELFVQELVYEVGTRGIGAPAEFPGWIAQTFNLLRSTGIPLFVLMVIAIAWWGRRLYCKEATRFEFVTVMFVLPYYLFIGSWSNTSIWYVLPLLPPFAVFTGRFVVGILRSDRLEGEKRSETIRTAMTAVLVGVLFLSAVYTGASVAQNGSDARRTATEWAETNIESGATVDLYSYRIYGPEFPPGVTVNRTVVTTTDGAGWNTVRDRLRCQQPDYIVLTNLHYERFMGTETNVSRTYRALLAGERGYRTAATFGPEPLSEGVRGRLLSGIVPRELDGAPYITILDRKVAEPVC